MNPHAAAAIEDLRLARSYIDDIDKDKGTIRANLAFAAKYVERARTKDPAAKLTTVGPKGEPVTYSLDDIAADLLFTEAVYELAGDPSEQKKRQAIETFERALKFAPYHVGYRSQLADVYLDLYDRAAALELAREGVRLSPNDINARKLLDRIESAPETKRPSFLQRNYGLVWGLGFLSVIAGVVVWVLAQFGKANGDLAFFLLTGGGIAWAYGHFKDRS